MFCVKSVAILMFVFRAIIVSSHICDSGSGCCLMEDWECSNTMRARAANVTCVNVTAPIAAVQICHEKCSGTTTLICDLCKNCTCYGCFLITRENEKVPNIWIIIIASSVGGGGVVVIIIIVVVICCCCRRSKRDQMLPENPPITAESRIIEMATGALQASTTNKNVSKSPSRSVRAPRCYENQARQQKDFVQGIMQQNENVLRYAKDPTDTSTKPSQPQESCDQNHREYENMAQTQNLAHVTKLVLSERLEAKKLLGSAHKLPSHVLGAALTVHDLKKKTGKLKTDELNDDGDDDSQVDYVEMNNHLEQGVYENLVVTDVEGSGKCQGNVEKTKSSDIRPKVALKPPKKLSNAGQNKTLESNEEVKDYENASDFKKAIGLGERKTIDISTAKKCIADKKNERKLSDSDSNDYENTEEFKKEMSPKDRTSHEATKNVFSKVKSKEIDSDKEDLETSNAYEIKKAMEIKAGRVEAKKNNSKNECKMVGAPENNVTIKPVATTDNNAPYENISFTRKR